MSTERVARFISETQVKDIPKEAFRIAKLGITDFIGVALAGNKEPLSKIVKEFVKETGGTPEAGVIGTGFRASPYMAAMANGALGHALDYDDMHRMWIGHPSVALAPAILAMGEKTGVSGRDVLTAYIIGFEVGAYIGMATGMAHYVRGWHNTSTLGSLAAAAAVARLLKLDVHQSRMALGIAASWAGGLRQNFGTMAKPLHAGMAAANGVLSGTLAQKGFTADENILEAPMGFVSVFGNEGADWEKADGQLGRTYAMVSHGTIFKPYPSCGATHSAIEAALILKKKYELSPGDVDRINVDVTSVVPKVCTHHQPATAMEGKFSMEYCVAVSLLDGAAFLSQFTDDRAKDPVLQDLIRRVTLVESYPDAAEAGQEKVPQRVSIMLKDKTEVSHEIIYPKGSPQNPMTSDEFNSKYIDCASLAISRGKAERSLGLLHNMEDLEKVGDVMSIVTA